MYNLIKKKYSNKYGGSSQLGEKTEITYPLLRNTNIPLKWGNYFLQIKQPTFVSGYYSVDNNLNCVMINDNVNQEEYNNNVKLDLLNYINVELVFFCEKLSSNPNTYVQKIFNLIIYLLINLK